MLMDTEEIEREALRSANGAHSGSTTLTAERFVRHAKVGFDHCESFNY